MIGDIQQEIREEAERKGCGKASDATLRDLIAIEAMRGMLESGRANLERAYEMEIADRAYHFADAMLIARTK